MYAHVTGSTVDQIGQPPATAFDGTRWWDLRGLDPQALAATGWRPVVETPRPADTDTTTWDVTWTVTGATVTQGWVERPKTASEVSDQERVAAEETLLTQLQAGIAQIKAARDAAQADTATAATLKTQAESLSATIATRKTAVDASTPAATVAYVTAVRNELSWIDAQLKVIVDAMAGMYAYRHAVDTNAVMTDNALLWLAKQGSGDVLAAG